MKQKIAIYLAGSIKKDHERGEKYFWAEEEMSLLKKHLDDFEVSCLNPALRADDLSDQFSVFGRDMLQVFCSDIVFVDARDRRGLGVGAEMMWAKLNQIPVVIWAPKNSHYHKSQTTILGIPVANFIHPFVESLSDRIVETLEEGASWIRAVKQNPLIEIKGIEHIEKAMDYYKSQQLIHDQPMQVLLDSHEELKGRMQFR